MARYDDATASFAARRPVWERWVAGGGLNRSARLGNWNRGANRRRGLCGIRGKQRRRDDDMGRERADALFGLDAQKGSVLDWAWQERCGQSTGSDVMRTGGGDAFCGDGRDAGWALVICPKGTSI
ncbi:hypothetical protein M0R45_006675 [Rubus argutus]|uniref:Uncharacterized protein n=1 Tax=Rubus argutus TaxID=59490 RepID=A0AAW1YRP4_RUBAR